MSRQRRGPDRTWTAPSGHDLIVGCGLVAAAAVGATSSGHSTGAVVRTVALAALVAAVVLAALAVLRRRQSRHLQAAIGTLEQLADGTLPSVVAGGSTGDAAALARVTLRISDRLRLSLSEVERCAQTLSERWHDVNHLAWEMTQTAEGTVSEAAATSGAAEDVSRHMQLIAAATEEMSATIREVARNAFDASAVADEGAAKVGGASARVELLEAASSRIEEVLKLITSIAGQTHLLALNATIEAARAGEEGRGFAVVAGEVKALAKQTSLATERVSLTVQEIRAGSGQMAEAMADITETITKVTGSQQAIAGAVEQQTTTTSSIGESTSQAADKAAVLADNVAQLTTAVRRTAYSGARARTLAAELADVEKEIGGILGAYEFERIHHSVEVAAVDPRDTGVVRSGPVTTVQDYVCGEGLNAWSYTGMWGHAMGNLEADGSNSHSSMPGDTAVLRFVGTQVRLFGVDAPNHGRASVCVDGGEKTVIEQYGDNRAHGILHWQSPLLPVGEHTLEVCILGESDERSAYVWINVDRAEIDD